MLSVVIGVFIYLFGMIFVTFIDTESVQAANKTTNMFGTQGGPGLDCGPASNPNQNVSDGVKLTCLATDAANPYWILLIVSLAGGAIIGQLIR